MLRDLAAGLGLTPGQLALAWLLAQGPDVVPIPGSRREERIAENAAAAAAVLSPADAGRLARALPRAAWAGNRTSFAAPVTEKRTVRGKGGALTMINVSHDAAGGRQRVRNGHARGRA